MRNLKKIKTFFEKIQKAIKDPNQPDETECLTLLSWLSFVAIAMGTDDYIALQNFERHLDDISPRLKTLCLETDFRKAMGEIQINIQAIKESVEGGRRIESQLGEMLNFLIGIMD